MSVTASLRLLAVLALAVVVDYHAPGSHAAERTEAAEPSPASDARPRGAADSGMSCHAPEDEPAEQVVAPSFEREVLPIVRQCTPCHFPGGSMYARLPFDKPATIHHLGDKVLPRIKNEEERDVIRRFLASE